MTAEQLSLLPDTPTLLVKLPSRVKHTDMIKVMHRMYGTSAGHKCGGCIHFERHQAGSTWFKCGLTVQTGGTGTDWRAKWQACGKWE